MDPKNNFQPDSGFPKGFAYFEMREDDSSSGSRENGCGQSAMAAKSDRHTKLRHAAPGHTFAERMVDGGFGARLSFKARQNSLQPRKEDVTKQAEIVTGFAALPFLLPCLKRNAPHHATYPTTSRMQFASPLRYPGGKACLAGFLTDAIDLNDLRGCSYYEPYAGGAGAALSLLRDSVVSEIFINDADVRVNAFWKTILSESERFVDRVLSVPLTIKEWRRQHEVCTSPQNNHQFDVAFATFYMNRCNRSGVLTGAGPIGGFEQTGKWCLGVRFSREPLAERIRTLARLKSQIHISNLDAIDFLKSKLPLGNDRRRVFVYLDPPYVHKGQRLYLNAYENKDHRHLARYIVGQKTLPWFMSYDDTPLVRDLYVNQQIFSLPIRYSLQKKRTAEELIIAPHRLALPSLCKIHGRKEPL